MGRHIIGDLIKKKITDKITGGKPLDEDRRKELDYVLHSIRGVKLKHLGSAIQDAKYKYNAPKIAAKVDTEASTPAKSKSKKDLKIRSVGYTSMYQGSGRNLV